MLASIVSKFLGRRFTTRSSKTNFWIDSHVSKNGGFNEYPQFDRNLQTHFDVAVIGGGWVGLNTALKLHEKGQKVIVLEAEKIPIGSVASWSTAKVSAQHQIKYSKLLDKHGKKVAKLYHDANQEAIQDIENIIQKYNIKCQWSKASHIVFAQTNQELQILKEEQKAANEIGFKATLMGSNIEELPKSMNLTGSLKVDDQAHMNPVSYLSGIAQVLSNAKVPIYEMSRVKDVTFVAPHVVSVEGGHKFTANNIVVASHLPILNRSGHFAKVTPSKSYCIAVTLENEGKMIKDTYISGPDSPTISLRPADDGKVLIICGAGHPVGEYPSAWGYPALENWARNHYPVKEVISRWSAMDYYSSDLLPFMGYAMHGSSSLFVATGFGKWGFTNGAAASQVITDLITGNKENKYHEVFDARRWDLTKSSMTDLEILAHVANHFFGDRFNCEEANYDALQIGEGGVFKDPKDGKVAVFKDELGAIHKFKPACTHLVALFSGIAQTKYSSALVMEVFLVHSEMLFMGQRLNL